VALKVRQTKANSAVIDHYCYCLSTKITQLQFPPSTIIRENVDSSNGALPNVVLPTTGGLMLVRILQSWEGGNMPRRVRERKHALVRLAINF